MNPFAVASVDVSTAMKIWPVTEAGVLPIEPGVSWETHLAAALIGLLLAIALRRLDIPPRVRYTWENEEENDSGE